MDKLQEKNSINRTGDVAQNSVCLTHAQPRVWLLAQKRTNETSIIRGTKVRWGWAICSSVGVKPSANVCCLTWASDTQENGSHRDADSVCRNDHSSFLPADIYSLKTAPPQRLFPLNLPLVQLFMIPLSPYPSVIAPYPGSAVGNNCASLLHTYNRHTEHLGAVVSPSDNRVLPIPLFCVFPSVCPFFTTLSLLVRSVPRSCKRTWHLAITKSWWSCTTSQTLVELLTERGYKLSGITTEAWYLW